jgi:hypothetical protein
MCFSITTCGLSINELLQDSGVALYSGLVEVEFAETGFMKTVEALTVDTLDNCAFDGTLPTNFSNFFVSK